MIDSSKIDFCVVILCWRLIVKALLAAGADANAADGDGETALHRAAKGGHAEISRATGLC